MKLNKSVIIPIFFFAFAALGLEALVLPYVPFGAGRWSDSVGTNVSNRSSRINGNLNVTGNYYKNGVLFTGGSGSPIVASEEGVAIESDMTSINFVGNTFTAHSPGAGEVQITSTIDTNDLLTRFNLDTSDIALQSEGAAFTGNVTAQSFQTTGTITGDELTIINAGSFGALLTVSAGIQIADATKVIINSGNDILYKVTTGGAHIFETQSGTDLLKVDSTNGVGFTGGRVSADPLSGQLLRIKTFRGVLGAAGGAETKFTHGVLLSKIVSVDWLAKNDTTVAGSGNDQTYTPNNSVAGNGAFLYDTYIDSLYCTARLRSATTGLFNDSVRCMIIYYE